MFIQKKKKRENGKFPGTGSPSWLGPLSQYNALPTELRGTCHEGRANFKIICNKYSMYCKVQVGKDSEEDVFWLCDDITTKTVLLNLIMLKLSSVPMHVLN